MIHLTSDDQTYRIDLDGLRREVEDVVRRRSRLTELLGPAKTETESIARAVAGQERQALAAVPGRLRLAGVARGRHAGSRRLKRIAIAVECFHKASLVHDDIEDGDDLRYGEPSVHAEHGVPVALNVGDLLLGRRLPADRRMRRAGGDQGGDAQASRRPAIARSAWAKAPNCAGRAAQAARLVGSARHLPPEDGARRSRWRCGSARPTPAPEDDVDEVLQPIQRSARHRLPDSRRPRRPGRRIVDQRSRRPCGLRCRWRWPTSGPRGRSRRSRGRLAAAMRTAVDAGELRRLVAAERNSGALPELLESYKEEAVRSLAGLAECQPEGTAAARGRQDFQPRSERLVQ